MIYLKLRNCYLVLVEINRDNYHQLTVIYLANYGE